MSPLLNSPANSEVYQPDNYITLVYIPDRCKGCALCIDACKMNVMKLSSSKYSGRGYPLLDIIDSDHCVGCARCEMACPDFAIYVIRKRKGDSFELEK